MKKVYFEKIAFKHNIVKIIYTSKKSFKVNLLNILIFSVIQLINFIYFNENLQKLVVQHKENAYVNKYFFNLFNEILKV